jgi:hypothetical protein
MRVSTKEPDKMAEVYTAKKNYTLDMSDPKVKKIIIMIILHLMIEFTS